MLKATVCAVRLPRLPGAVALFIILSWLAQQPLAATPLAQTDGGGTVPPPLADYQIYLPAVYNFNAISTIASPNGEITVQIGLSGANGMTGVMRYRVHHGGQPLITASNLGLTTDDGQTPTIEFEWLNATTRTVSQTISLPVAEVGLIPDRYNETVIELRDRQQPLRTLNVVVRVYDEGVAFRYLLPARADRKTLTIQSEQTEFFFAEDHTVFFQKWTEAAYEKAPLSQIDSPVETPLTLQTANGAHLAVIEAAVDNYPRMDLTKSSKSDLGLTTALAGSAFVALPFQTPWRVIMIGKRPADLLNHSYLMYALAEPTRIADTSWIKPGTAMRVMVLTTERALEAIDFAKQRGIEYVEFDAGWYELGYFEEFNPQSDARVPIAGLDMPRVVQVAHQRGIGVVLYVNYVAMQQQLDEILPLYQSWGVAGLKFGFVDGRTQEGINFVHRAIEKAAEHQMVVDVHDNYRPSGMTRTYPNLLTQEGVRGNEHFSGAEHNTTVALLRFPIGAADYTVPYYSGLLNVTRAHQLAISILFYSPLKFVFWYDLPSDYHSEPEVDLFGRLPTTWDEISVLHDAIGDAVAVARRHGDDWYVGVITDEAARSLPIDLSFLDETKTYSATIYADLTATSVQIETKEVNRYSVLTATMLSSGGQAIWLTPKSEESETSHAH